MWIPRLAHPVIHRAAPLKKLLFLFGVKQLAVEEVVDSLSESGGACAQSPDDLRLIVRDPLRLFARLGCA